VTIRLEPDALGKLGFNVKGELSTHKIKTLPYLPSFLLPQEMNITKYSEHLTRTKTICMIGVADI